MQRAAEFLTGAPTVPGRRPRSGNLPSTNIYTAAESTYQGAGGGAPRDDYAHLTAKYEFSAVSGGTTEEDVQAEGADPYAVS